MRIVYIIILCSCDHNGDGQVDYVEFIHFLTTHASSQRSEEELTSTNRAAYSSRAHVSALFMCVLCAYARSYVKYKIYKLCFYRQLNSWLVMKVNRINVSENFTHC